jgi:hypothetical protein
MDMKLGRLSFSSAFGLEAGPDQRFSVFADRVRIDPETQAKPFARASG